MPSIVSSVFTIDNIQSDGRRVIIETHTDDSGTQHQITYMCDEGFDINAKLTQDALDLTAQLVALAAANGT